MARLGIIELAALFAVFISGCGTEPTSPNAVAFTLDDDGIFHVHQGGDIQAALDAAANSADGKHVLVHAGIYRPTRYGQAFLRLIRRHDGIKLEADGSVTLSAANPDIAEKGRDGFPAIVNHVVYFGDGISRKTVLRGFRITGANNYVMGVTSPEAEIEPDPLPAGLDKGLFFYTDGGGIKIFGRSYPTIENVEVRDNYSSPCGAGVSVEHQGHVEGSVLFRNCVFRGNTCPVTGAAVDLLHGSSAEIENCLFVANLSNSDLDTRGKDVGKWKAEHGAGALTVFPTSRVIVRNCTFTANRNGVDDSGRGNVYEDCIFWQNNASGGWLKGPRYEFDIQDGSGVRGCFVGGDINDLRGQLDREENVLGCEDPAFDAEFVPRNDTFQHVGYRPK